MDLKLEGHMAPKFYGVTTVGERGQVVIPAEARRDYDIKPADKLVVLGGHNKGGIIITKAETLTRFLSKTIGMMAQFEEVLKADIKPPQKGD
ncbi:MAG: AbrB/MazE/SpoVT family DNA-binding domain-containing protein [Chloroflexota bacterium]